jgi:hypothetical protein
MRCNQRQITKKHLGEIKMANIDLNVDVDVFEDIHFNSYEQADLLTQWLQDGEVDDAVVDWIDQHRTTYLAKRINELFEPDDLDVHKLITKVAKFYNLPAVLLVN